MKFEDARICVDCHEVYKGDMVCPECSHKSGIRLTLYIQTIYTAEEQGC